MKRIVPFILAISLSSCGQSVAEFKINLAIQEYRQTCFGSDTVGCQNMAADIQIMQANYFLVDLQDNQKDKIVQICGQVAYDNVINKINKLLEVIEEARPNIFLRVFMSGGTWSPSRVPDFVASDYAALVDQACFNSPNLKAALGKLDEQSLRENPDLKALADQLNVPVPEQQSESVMNSSTEEPHAKQENNVSSDSLLEYVNQPVAVQQPDQEVTEQNVSNATTPESQNAAGFETRADNNSGAVPSDSCIDTKVHNFHSNAGEEALVTADMLEEWKTECGNAADSQSISTEHTMQSESKTVEITNDQSSTLQEHQNRVESTQPPTIGPSFSCEKASTYIEKSICNNEMLAKLDVALSNNYKNLLNANINGDQVRQVKADQKIWLSARNSCSDDLCISGAYKKRIDELCNYYSSVGLQAVCTYSVDIN